MGDGISRVSCLRISRLVSVYTSLPPRELDFLCQHPAEDQNYNEKKKWGGDEEKEENMIIMTVRIMIVAMMTVRWS